MNRTVLAASFVLALPVFLLSSCTSTTENSQSLKQVDDLLGHIERLQVETLVGKEKAHAALDALVTLTAPSFAGDAAATYGQFRDAIGASEVQARTIGANLPPMKSAAEGMFQQWTVDLEHFGNTRLRAKSATRMEETRTRYQSALSTATAVQVAYDAYNSELRDTALFLGHDFNGAAIASIANDVTALHDELTELDLRFDACVFAARAYVEAAALHGQIDAAPPEPATTTQAATEAPAAPAASTPPATPRKRRITTLPPATNTTGAASTSGAPATTPPAGGAPQGGSQH